jgi:hypothetical protein
LTLAALAPATTQRIAFERCKLAPKAELIFVPYVGSADEVIEQIGAMSAYDVVDGSSTGT